MSDKKLVIDIESFNTLFLIKKDTGIIYSVQTGGQLCNHPICEGFYIEIGHFCQDFDDTKYYKKDNELLNNLDIYLNAINDNISNGPVGWNSMGNMAFWNEERWYVDYERVHEAEEGWWPVIFKGAVGEVKDTYYGYIHTGNSD